MTLQQYAVANFSTLTNSYSLNGTIETSELVNLISNDDTSCNLMLAGYNILVPRPTITSLNIHVNLL